MLLWIRECPAAQLFSLGSRLWGILKVPFYGCHLGPVDCISPRRSVNGSHRQDHCVGQVTCYGVRDWLPFMGAISTFEIENNATAEADVCRQVPAYGNRRR